MRSPAFKILMCGTLVLGAPHFALAQSDAEKTPNFEFDPFDPTESFGMSFPSTPEEDKTADELVADANALMMDERLLDARTKLLRALQKDPKNLHAHQLLAGYYMVHVGHFRLALKYSLRAMELFKEQNGEPPYRSGRTMAQHGQLLYLLMQARLNLDNYAGALEVLDQFTAYGYFAEWYAGSRAWVLMKLGRLDEATKIARLGVLTGTDGARTLNMLGILLSMQHQRLESLQVFKEAIAHEMSLGKMGEPATPLNNSGEVYKEIFDDDRAESSFLKATSLPDGCENVLPSLNLAILMIEQLKLGAAKQAMDKFESCIAQFPLRNGEEHRALVALLRARLALLTGRPDEAIRLIEQSRERRQWFGKIGTNQEDLLAALSFSMAQAQRARSNHLASTIPLTWIGRLEGLRSKISSNLKSWWFGRRARQVLAEDLSNLEDLYVRNTDSLLEYPTLGEILAPLPRSVLRSRIELEQQSDDRKGAAPFYEAWLAENSIHAGETAEGLEQINVVLERARAEYDSLLILHVLTLRLGLTDKSSELYARLAHRIFSMNRAQLRSYGFSLPVAVPATMPAEIRDTLFAGSFEADTGNFAQYEVRYELSSGQHGLVFRDVSGKQNSVQVRGDTPAEVVNKLSDEVFRETL